MPRTDAAPSRPDRRGGHDARPALGRQGEEIAAGHMRRRGFRVLERGARTRWGELDLVCADARVLVFVEVKTRRASPGAEPLGAIDAAKRRRLRRLAAAWLAEHPERPRVRDLRLDAIGVLVDAGGRLVALEHVEDAW